MKPDNTKELALENLALRSVDIGTMPKLTLSFPLNRSWLQPASDELYCSKKITQIYP